MDGLWVEVGGREAVGGGGHRADDGVPGGVGLIGGLERRESVAGHAVLDGLDEGRLLLGHAGGLQIGEIRSIEAWDGGSVGDLGGDILQARLRYDGGSAIGFAWDLDGGGPHGIGGGLGVGHAWEWTFDGRFIMADLLNGRGVGVFAAWGDDTGEGDFAGFTADHVAGAGEEAWDEGNFLGGSAGVPGDPNVVGCAELAFGEVLGELFGCEAEAFIGGRFGVGILFAEAFIEAVDDEFPFDGDGLGFFVIEVDASTEAAGDGVTWERENILRPDDGHAMRDLVFFFAPWEPRLAFGGAVFVFGEAGASAEEKGKAKP